MAVFTQDENGVLVFKTHSRHHGRSRWGEPAATARGAEAAWAASSVTAKLAAEDGRALAWMRACAVPVFWIIGVLGYMPVAAAFHPVAFVAAAWALGSNRWLIHARPSGKAMNALACVDLVSIGLLLEFSGGLDSRARHLAFVIPVALAFTFRPRQILVLACGLAVAYTAASLDELRHAEANALRTFASFWVSFGWACAASMLLAAARLRRDERIGRLGLDRLRLTSGLVDAQDDQRRTLAEELHDDALQHLLAAKQDLDEAIELHDPELQQSAAGGLQTGIERLRALMRERHPMALEQQDLKEGLRAICARHAPRGGFLASLDVQPQATGHHEQTLLACARELVLNAAKHAQATNLTVTVNRIEEAVVLEVTDDGRGLTASRPSVALSEGHIGLAACGERARRHGGSLLIENAPGGGTTARIEIPDAAPAHKKSAGHP